MKHIFYEVKPGDVYNYLTVLDIKNVIRGITSPRYEVQLLCRCSYCGSEKWYPKYSVVHGKTKSCGCGLSKTRHGEWHTRLYGIWSGIKRRCYVKTFKGYKHYGGRGITMCEEWRKDYLNFRKWALENGYNEKLTIDRIDVNGNYCPENCRWATYLTQQNNKRNNHTVTYKGQTKTLSEWERIFNLHKGNIAARLRLGMTFEEAIATPVGKRGSKPQLYEAFGKKQTMQEWADEIGISKQVLFRKYHWSGDDLEKALTKPKHMCYADWCSQKPPMRVIHVERSL